jgi:hypothetical protein
MWNVDLNTEDGALSAAQIGGFACFIAAGLGLVGIALVVAMGTSRGLPVATLATASVALAEVLILAAAGFRLRAGKGIVWGSVAAVLLAIELVVKVITPSITGIMIDAILLIGVINGIRGVRALRRIDLNPADAAEIFS